MNKERNRCTVRFLGLAGFILILFIALTGQVARAVPVLQLGVSFDGGVTFVPYTTQGLDEETAFVSPGSFSMWLGGAYGPNVTILDGGNYDALSLCTGSCLGTIPGPILVASVPEGSLGTGTVTINGVLTQPYLTRTTLFDILSASGNPDGRLLANHYPTQDAVSDFMFFDISAVAPGRNPFIFAATPGGVRDFADSPGPYSTGTGEEYVVNVVVSGFSRVHFDLIAIETSQLGRHIVQTVSVIENNPFSHDITVVPEPGTLFLLGTGLIGAAGFARRRFLKRRNSISPDVGDGVGT